MAKEKKQTATQETGPEVDFFTALEDQVNGAIQEPTTEVNEGVGPEEVTQQTQNKQVSENQGDVWESGENPYKKRYSDSSKEARKMNEELETLRPFVPILNAMRQDGNLVEHVKNYLVNGGAPAQSVSDKLNLPEDFVYDGQDAMTDPNSDSAKVLNSHVDELVQRKVAGMISNEKKALAANQAKAKRAQEEIEFKKKHSMTDEEFENMVGKAKKHTLTLEDVYYLMNKDKASQNVASSTKQEMLNQMKNFQNMPSSVGGVNSTGSAKKSGDDQLFDSILNSDKNIDSLFG